MNVSSTSLTVYAALAANLAIAITKFVAAFFTGSSAMLSEGFHSLVDTSNQVLLLYGQHRASRPPDREHPLGHGRELYFWSFIVAVLIFGLGAGLSLYEGVQHVMAPKPLHGSYTANYIVLGISFLFEAASWGFALHNFRRSKGNDDIVEAIQESKDPPSFIVLLEDSAALIGLAIAAAGIGAAQYFDEPVLDGVASIGIGLLLAGTAFFLARESKSLLIGEAASPRVERAIRRIVENDAAVEGLTRLYTLHLAPDQIVAVLQLDFSDVSSDQIESAIARIQNRVRSEVPHVITTFITPPGPLLPQSKANSAHAGQG